MSRSQIKLTLIALDLFVAATAVGGGLALAVGLEGGRFPASWLTGTPFTDYTGPGLLLAVIVGGSAAVAALALVRRWTLAPRASIIAGLLLAAWIVGEIVLVRADDELVSPMEALYLAVSLALVALAIGLGRTPTEQRSDPADPAPPPAPTVGSARYVRPTFVMAHIVNPIMAHLGGTLVLSVTGRRTGRPVRVPLGRPFDLDGVRYLVAGGGETHWVRNLRAAGVGELRLHGTDTAFRAVALDGPERDRIVMAYRATVGGTGGPSFRALPEPRDHPVFRVDPIGVPTSPARSLSVG